MKEDLSPRLEQRIIGPRLVIEISREEYASLVRARKTLADALAFEQRFELLLGSYLDFEVTATRLSLETVAGVDYTTYLPSAIALMEANRLLMNLMTAARAYIDQVKQDFKHLDLATSFKEQAATALSVEYDDSFEYRFMEALRNHVQHKGVPAHGYAAGDGLHEALTFRCMKEQLIKAKDFKADVLNNMPEHVELRAYARTYVERLSKVHVSLRENVTATTDSARKEVESAIYKYANANNGQALGLHAHKISEGREEWVGLMVEWDDVRLHLARKNGARLQFSRRQEKIAARE